MKTINYKPLLHDVLNKNCDLSCRIQVASDGHHVAVIQLTACTDEQAIELMQEAIEQLRGSDSSH